MQNLNHTLYLHTRAPSCLIAMQCWGNSDLYALLTPDAFTLSLSCGLQCSQISSRKPLNPWTNLTHTGSQAQQYSEWLVHFFSVSLLQIFNRLYIHFFAFGLLCYSREGVLHWVSETTAIYRSCFFADTAWLSKSSECAHKHWSFWRHGNACRADTPHSTWMTRGKDLLLFISLYISPFPSFSISLAVYLTLPLPLLSDSRHSEIISFSSLSRMQQPPSSLDLCERKSFKTFQLCFYKYSIALNETVEITIHIAW